MDQQTPVAAEDAPARWHGPARAVGFVGGSLVVGAFPSLSMRSTLTMIGLGGFFFWIGMVRRFARRQKPRHIGRYAAWWLLPVLVFVSFELTNFVLGSTWAHPTLSALSDPVLQHYWARAAVFLGWITGFWGLVRR